MMKSLETLDLQDPQRLTREIPKYLRVLLADAVMAFAQLEYAMGQAIRSYQKLTPHEGRIFTNCSFTEKKRLIIRLIAEGKERSNFEKSTNRIWPALSFLANDRNLLVHGRLFMLDRQVLIGVFDRPHEDPEASEGARFSKGRLSAIASEAERLANMFFDLASLYESPEHEPTHPVGDRTEIGLIAARKKLL